MEDLEELVIESENEIDSNCMELCTKLNVVYNYHYLFSNWIPYGFNHLIFKGCHNLFLNSF